MRRVHVHSPVVVSSTNHGVFTVSRRGGVRRAHDRPCAEALRLPSGVQNLLSVHCTGVKGGCLVGRERVAQALVAARDLDRLVLDVIVGSCWAPQAFLILSVLMGQCTVVVVSGRCLVIFESITRSRTY